MLTRGSPASGFLRSRVQPRGEAARLFASASRGVSAAREGRGHLNSKKRHPIFFRALLEVGCKRIVRLNIVPKITTFTE